MYTVHNGKTTKFNILNTYINADTQYMYYTQYVTKAQYIEILIGLKDGSSTSRLLILRPLASNIFGFQNALVVNKSSFSAEPLLMVLLK